jgi:hypothetical protein
MAAEVRFRTAVADARAEAVQRALVLPRIDASGLMTAAFRAPAGALALAVHLPPRADYELGDVVLEELAATAAIPVEAAATCGDARAAGTWSAAAVGGTGIAGDARRVIVSGASGDAGHPQLLFTRAAALPAAADLILRARLAARPASWLLPFLGAAPAHAMVAALLANGQVDAADRIDRARRFAALAAAPALRATGPDGPRERAISVRGGWPGTGGVAVAVHVPLDLLDTAVAGLRLPWPRPRAGAADALPRLVCEPPAPPPAVRREGDAIEFRFPHPVQLLAVRAEGCL